MVPLAKYCSIDTPENSYKINKNDNIESIYKVLFVYGWSSIYTDCEPNFKTNLLDHNVHYL